MKALVTGFIFIAIILSFFCLRVPKSYEDNNATLYAKIDSLLLVNDSLEGGLAKLDSVNLELNYRLQNQRQKIVYIKQKANEKTTSINTYNDSQLVGFFANIKTCN